MKKQVFWAHPHNTALVRCLAAKYRPSTIARAFGISRNALAGYYNRIGYTIPDDVVASDPGDVYDYAKSLGFNCVALLTRDGELLTTFEDQSAASAETSTEKFAQYMVPDVGPRPKRPKDEPENSAPHKSPATRTTVSVPDTPQMKVLTSQIVKTPEAQLTDDDAYVNVSKFKRPAAKTTAPRVFQNVQTFGAVALKMEDPEHEEEEVAEEDSVPQPVEQAFVDAEVEEDRREFAEAFPDAKTIFELKNSSCRTPLWDFDLLRDGETLVGYSKIEANEIKKYKIRYKSKLDESQKTKFYCGAPVTGSRAFCDKCLWMLSLSADAVAKSREDGRLAREAARREAIARKTGRFNA